MTGRRTQHGKREMQQWRQRSYKGWAMRERGTHAAWRGAAQGHPSGTQWNDGCSMAHSWDGSTGCQPQSCRAHWEAPHAPLPAIFLHPSCASACAS